MEAILTLQFHDLFSFFPTLLPSFKSQRFQEGLISHLAKIISQLHFEV